VRCTHHHQAPHTQSLLFGLELQLELQFACCGSACAGRRYTTHRRSRCETTTTTSSTSASSATRTAAST
jgi:hypothetical protein